MTDEMSGWIALREALGFATGPGLWAFALLAAVALTALVLFRPQIGRLLDRAVVLRVFGVCLLALPSREPGDAPAARPPEPPADPPGETPPPI